MDEIDIFRWLSKAREKRPGDEVDAKLFFHDTIAFLVAPRGGGGTPRKIG